MQNAAFQINCGILPELVHQDIMQEVLFQARMQDLNDMLMRVAWQHIKENPCITVKTTVGPMAKFNHLVLDSTSM